MGYTILLVDDEIEIVELLRLYLEKEDFRVIEAFNGRDALKQFENEPIDIALLDIMLPDMNGFQVLKEMRQRFHMPVLFLSAKGEDHNKILGLELGADDYITKPFNPLEVVARIQAHLRRAGQFNRLAVEKIVQNDQIVAGDLVLDKASCTVCRADKPIGLTSIEYKILVLLMESPGRIFTKKKIYEAVWEDYFANDDNTIMVHISKLREKIEDQPQNPMFIKTIRGLGYKFEKMVEETKK